MLTIIAFLLTILGCINWLMIGLLQYDFIAGIFGFQASVFSRIIYIIFGSAGVFLVIKLIKEKGTISVFSRRNKKDLEKNLKNLGNKKANVESSKDLYENREINQPDLQNQNFYNSQNNFENNKSASSINFDNAPSYNNHQNNRNFNNFDKNNSSGFSEDESENKGLFDEDF